MGGVKVGHVTARATVFDHSQWIDLALVETEDPVLVRGGKRASDYLKAKLADPARAARVAHLRSRVGNDVAANNGRETLSSLRMRAGLSQSALATKMGTRQPNIARWERSPAGMQVETMVKLAQALGVANEVLMSAITQQLEMPDPAFAKSES